MKGTASRFENLHLPVTVRLQPSSYSGTSQELQQGMTGGRAAETSSEQRGGTQCVFPSGFAFYSFSITVDFTVLEQTIKTRLKQEKSSCRSDIRRSHDSWSGRHTNTQRVWCVRDTLRVIWGHNGRPGGTHAHKGTAHWHS